MLKKICFIIIVLSLLFGTVPEFAYESTIKVDISGKYITMDSEPLIINNRIVVPIRTICENLNTSVIWEPEKQEITISGENLKVMLRINKTTAYVNDKIVNLDLAPVIVNNRTMVPVRFIAESFGAKVDWNSSDRVVKISNIKENMKYETQNLRNDLNNSSSYLSSVYNKTYSEKPINEKSIKEFMPISFPVLGDIHTNTGEFESAIKDFSSLTPFEDLMVLNGDIVDNGVDGQFEMIKNCLSKNKNFLPKTVIKNIGNHEFYDSSKGVNSPLDITRFLQKFKGFSEKNDVYHDSWIKNYHFIFLGSEQCYTPELGAVQAFLSQNQLKWLNLKLSEGYEAKRPIFVFLHQPLTGNIDGFPFKQPTVMQSKELNEILSKYPEVVLITSHTHMALNSKSMIYINKPFLAVQTGSVHNPSTYSDDGKQTVIDSSQGVYIKVINNRLIIRGRDIKSKSWIYGAVYNKDLN